MEPWPFSHGYAVLGAWECCCELGFNGAMALQPWIRLAPSPTNSVHTASMEPWPFSHGYDLHGPAAGAHDRGFNGAMALQPWIHAAPGREGQSSCWLQWSHGPSAMDTVKISGKPKSIIKLQWSHGPSAMDTAPDAAIFADTGWASMEPWPFSHGYADHLRPAALENPELQWSHGPSAMDTAFAVEASRQNLCASMEPWPFSHGYVLKLSASAAGESRFNGAMALQPWIR